MVNMKSSGTRVEGLMAQPEEPEYPYGLCLTLNEEQIAKLGMYLPAVGETVMVEAKASVRAVSMNDTVEGGKSRRVELQITDMELGKGDGEEPSAAKVLYEMEDM